MFQIFAHSLKNKNKINLLSGTSVYFSVDSKMKLFFPVLFFLISKKLHYRSNHHIYIYICDYFLIFSISLSLFLRSLFFFSFYLCLIKQFTFISVCSNSKRVTTCIVKKSYTSKVKIYISFFFLVSHTPSPTPRFVIILLYPHTYTLTLSYNRISILYPKKKKKFFFFIIYFYLINITYKYNKLLCI